VKNSSIVVDVVVLTLRVISVVIDAFGKVDFNEISSISFAVVEALSFIGLRGLEVSLD